VADFLSIAARTGWQHSRSHAANQLILKDLLQISETGVTLLTLAFGNWECCR
jgi:hypothetical protein